MRIIDDLITAFYEDEWRIIKSLVFTKEGRYTEGISSVSSEPFGPFYVCADRESTEMLRELIKEL